MDKKNIRRIAYGGILTGLVLVATMFLQIPNGIGGYVNLGDGVIFISAMILGPFAGLAAALGSSLSDLILGYGVYIPATFVIKGVMGIVAGLMLKYAKTEAYLYKGFVFLICELIMISGYFGFETIVYDIAYSTGALMGNVIQAVAGIAIGLAFVPIVKKIFESEKFSV